MKPKRNHKPGRLDECQTPAYALQPLLPYLGHHRHIWEPAAGEGHLVNALEDAGHWVFASDILTGGDFFQFAPDQYDLICTNPPYSLKYKWLARCYELGKPFALLVPVETLGAKSCQRLIEKHSFEILLLDGRVNFKMPEKGWNSSAQFPVLWLCHNMLPRQVVFGHIEYPVETSGYVQMNLFAD